MIVSIVVIGKNEGWRLNKCFDSILSLINHNSNFNFEVIYVDSCSKDDSIEVARKFPFIKIFQLSGNMNAAIARNVGAIESTGDIIVFIDGDMEILPSFIGQVIKNGELVHDYVTGHIDDLFYSLKEGFLSCKSRTYSGSLPSKEQNISENGGFFIIKRSVWLMVNGMKNKYRKSQDIDFTLRLKGKRVQIVRVPFLAIKHHTIDYNDEHRMWDLFWKGDYFFAGLLFREHFFRFNFLLRTIRMNYTALTIAIIIISYFFNIFLTKIAIFFFLIILTLRTVNHTITSKKQIKKIPYIIERWFLQIFIDFSFWIGFLFFYPTEKKIKYTKK
jgi:glycosyltransferase involved in cell wall biosynthesis